MHNMCRIVFVSEQKDKLNGNDDNIFDEVINMTMTTIGIYAILCSTILLNALKCLISQFLLLVLLFVLPNNG